MIYATKQDAELAAIHANLAIDTTYKKWTVEQTAGGWTLVLTYAEFVKTGKRSPKYLIIAGILLLTTNIL